MILQINFNLNVPVAEYQKMAHTVARAFLGVPGLRWKIWLLDPAAQEAGGIYLFDRQASLDAYRNISMKQFDVMPELTVLTRGPFALTSNA